METLFDKNYTATIDVDSQKGFTPLEPNELPVSGGDEIAGELNENAKYGILRIMTKDAHSRNAKWVATENEPQLTKIENEPNLDLRWNSHCNVGENGFELMPGLPHPSEYNMLVYKGAESDMHPYGACYHDLNKTVSTGLIEFLKENDIKSVIVGGLAFDFCVKHTILELIDANFLVIVNESATRSIGDFNETQSELVNRGVIFVPNSDFLSPLFK